MYKHPPPQLRLALLVQAESIRQRLRKHRHGRCRGSRRRRRHQVFSQPAAALQEV